MQQTGVFVSSEELEEIKALLKEKGLKSASERCMLLATQKYDLPELGDSTFYGLTAKGEFIKPSPMTPCGSDDAFFQSRYSPTGRWIFGG